jgi:Rod binding domain-containing protein
VQIGATLAALPGPDTSHARPSKKIADAAKQFEAILLNEMLQSARASTEDADTQDSAVSDYSQQQFAQALAERGGLGIGKMLEVQLQKHET